jgi:hypothetical protein
VHILKLDGYTFIQVIFYVVNIHTTNFNTKKPPSLTRRKSKNRDGVTQYYTKGVKVIDTVQHNQVKESPNNSSKFIPLSQCFFNKPRKQKNQQP